MFAVEPCRGSHLPHIAICIPARDEARELPGLFGALEALDTSGGGPVRICLLLDGCTDASERVTADYRAASRHEVRIERAERACPNAGLARRRAVAMGVAALDGVEGLLLTTDADSRPAPDWLTTMTAALAQADVVAGRIVREGDRPNALQDRLETYYDRLFALRRRLDPVPWEARVTHHHTGGANLGIRSDVYRAIGGFAAVTSGEDARLADDASRAGFRVRRDAASVVRTSDRRHGRARQGLASTLHHLDRSDASSICVTHPTDAAWQYRLHAAARTAYLRPEAVAAMIGLTLDHVRGVARDCPNAEAFAMRVVPAAPGGMRAVSLPVAEMELARLVADRQAA